MPHPTVAGVPDQLFLFGSVCMLGKILDGEPKLFLLLFPMFNSIDGGFAMLRNGKMEGRFQLPLSVSPINRKSLLQTVPSNSKYEKKTFDNAVPDDVSSAHVNGHQRNEGRGRKW